MSCSECDRPVIARGLCHMHYKRLQLKGLPPRPTEQERFWSKVEKTNGCWRWLSSHNAYDYAVFRLQGNGKLVMAHRYMYELVHGPIPPGLVLDHAVCDNGWCINPDHVVATTQTNNLARVPRDWHGRLVKSHA